MRSSRAAPGWGTLMAEARDVIEAVRARGVDVAADVYPYTAGGTGMEATIPSWAHEGGRDSLRARQGRPAVRERLKREIETGSPGWWNIVEASGGWENVVAGERPHPEERPLRGPGPQRGRGHGGQGPGGAAFDLAHRRAARTGAVRPRPA